VVRSAYFGRVHGVLATPVVDRAALGSEPRPGPLLIDEYDATTLVPPGTRAWRDGSGNIVIEIGD
jgi:N-methylhydantoinase A